MNIAAYLEHLLKKEHLSTFEMMDIMRGCMTGEISDSQLAAFLALMRIKGETVEELTAAAQVMIEMAHTVDLGDDLVDIVGTGGDGKNTFNVSTVSSIVTSAAGARVAKHGNRSVSSRSGSTDLLMQAGIRLEIDDADLQRCMQQYKLCFLYAPHFHKAIQKARKVRQELGIRTFFNLIGPLVNPARPRKQVVGVFDKRWQKPLLDVLVNLGSEHTLVVCSRDGLDEISIAAPTDVLEYHKGEYKEWTINPQDYHCAHGSIDEIIADSPEQSFKHMQSVLQGEVSPARDIVLLNSAAALYCSDQSSSFEEGIYAAVNAIDSGAAHQRLSELQSFSQHLGKP
ncbi:anthranilate phosphoribosyltransferase [Legionella sp. 16cNR16C]|uniref:anthranilate phosphoribosyltransferase n=1 Tax=Legionella sp. 16cNR16C TaxID=2905656 RepID=UPI001E2F9E56|nr:anthranilate phosphoribosyltransferase [Legionella sp. 16cNR16C]MCE3044749.1 anthranilate phosphoribosyltransferase [Legionella sp. 16cNR16C]